MNQIKIEVKNKIARVMNTADEIICNNDYEAVFVLDEEWNGHEEKTAVFIWNGMYEERTFTGNTCEIPTLRKTNELKVGIYVGDDLATTYATVRCKRSIKCVMTEPQPEYIMPAVESILKAADDVNGLEPIVVNNVFRIGTIEQNLDIADPFETVTGRTSIEVPDGAKQYAKVVKIGGRANDRNDTAELGCAWAEKLLVDGKVVLDISKAYVRPCDSELDYIYFADGKWIYHDGSYMLWVGIGDDITDAEKENPADTEYARTGCTVIIKRATPVEVDVTDKVEGSGFLDISGADTIEIVSDNNADGNLDEPYGFAEIMFEV